MPRLILDFYGSSLALDCAEAGILDCLRRDFEYFHDPSARCGSAMIRLELTRGAGPAVPRSGWLRTSEYRVSDAGCRRTIAYSDGSLAEYDFRARAGKIWSVDSNRLHELGYLAVLSRIGEELDRRGMHRVHALGFGASGLGGLLLMPSGAGKSVLALELLRGGRLGLLSDDTPLVTRDLRLLAFPLRLGFGPGADLTGVPERWQRAMHRRCYGPKRLVDLGFFRDRVPRELTAKWLMVGKRVAGAAAGIEPAPRLTGLLALGLNLVVGVGIAQMSEYMLRPSPSLAGIAGSRLRTALSLTARLPVWRFILGSDTRQNAEVLNRFLEGQ
jgi:hypothetical protein